MEGINFWDEAYKLYTTVDKDGNEKSAVVADGSTSANMSPKSDGNTYGHCVGHKPIISFMTDIPGKKLIIWNHSAYRTCNCRPPIRRISIHL